MWSIFFLLIRVTINFDSRCYEKLSIVTVAQIVRNCTELILLWYYVNWDFFNYVCRPYTEEIIFFRNAKEGYLGQPHGSSCLRWTHEKSCQIPSLIAIHNEGKITQNTLGLFQMIFVIKDLCLAIGDIIFPTFILMILSISI